MKPKKNKAFTLIELLVVITIIGILSTIVTATFKNNIEKANDVKRMSNMHHILNNIQRDSVVTKNGKDSFIYDENEITKMLQEINYQAETSGEKICYFIGLARGTDENSGHDNQIAIATWGDQSSTLDGNAEGVLVVGTDQAVFNLSNTPITTTTAPTETQKAHTLFADDFFCEYPERMLKVQNAFAGRALNYTK